MRTESEPRKAAWTNDGCDSAPIHDHDSCWQVGCKTAYRRRPRRARNGEEPIAGPSASAPVKEQMWDILPPGHDLQGNELTFKAFLNVHYPEGCPYGPEDLERCKRNPDVIEGDFERTAFRLQDECEEWYTEQESIAEQERLSREAPEPGFSKIAEHIAGPNCVASRYVHAYSGYRVSFEEMKACTTVQCLGPKDSDYMVDLDRGWKPLPDDEDFERTSNYCLSGLGDRPGPNESSTPCYPDRHARDDLVPGFQDFSWGNLPFHPYCLEVYKRVSLLHQGDVGIEGLAEKFSRGVLKAPMHPAVWSAQDQWWDHENGSEFLVANPVHIPALRDILEHAMQTESDVDLTEHFSNMSVASPATERDTFNKLPQELRDSILDHLPSEDIANLRLASSSFHRLTNSLWHRLVREDMPWLWEAWCSRSYSFWACTTKRTLKHADKFFQRKTDATPSLPAEQQEAHKAKIQRSRRNFRKPKPARQLDPLRTNWHWLYCAIKQERKNIKGLQNRERIWYALAHVVQDTAESKEAIEKVHADYKRVKAG